MGKQEKDRIEYRQWGVSSPRAVFILVHGLGAHTGRWEAMAEFFLKQGIASYAIDLGSLDRPGYFQAYQDDTLELYRIAAKSNPGAKIFLAGESMGALISILLASSHPRLFSGLICISPAFVSTCKPAFRDYLKMSAALLYNPKKKFKLPFESSMCTRDLEYRKKIESDPKEYRTVSARFVMEIQLAQARSRSAIRKISAPSLFLLGGDDKMIDIGAAKTIFNVLSSRGRSLVEFPGMYHSLSIELGREKVFEAILEWIERRI